jgi:hypothetical protein
MLRRRVFSPGAVRPTVSPTLPRESRTHLGGRAAVHRQSADCQECVGWTVQTGWRGVCCDAPNLVAVTFAARVCADSGTRSLGLETRTGDQSLACAAQSARHAAVSE